MTPEEYENKFNEILNVLDTEISFYIESVPPLRYRIMCWICRIRPRNEVIVDELGLIYGLIFRIWMRGAE
jgi:hypothetical protein